MVVSPRNARNILSCFLNLIHVMNFSSWESTMPTNRYQRFSDALAEAARAQIGTEQQAAIAHELGLSASYVSKLLSGNHRPSTRVLASIASKFGEDLAELVDPASVRPRIYVASPVMALDGSDIEANRKDVRRIVDSLEAQGIDSVSYTHLTLPTTPYV